MSIESGIVGGFASATKTFDETRRIDLNGLSHVNNSVQIPSNKSLLKQIQPRILEAQFTPPKIRKDKYGCLIIRRSQLTPNWKQIDQQVQDLLKNVTDPGRIVKIEKQAIADKYQRVQTAEFYQRLLLDNKLLTSRDRRHKVTFVDQISKGKVPLEEVWLVESQKHYNSQRWSDLKDQFFQNARSKKVVTCSCQIF